MAATAYKDVSIDPNMPTLSAQIVFDSPKSFPSKKPGGGLRYAFKLKLLADYGEFRAGDEVTLWTSNEKYVDTLRGFRKGDRISISNPLNPGDRWPTFQVRPMGLEEGPLYDAPPTNGNGSSAGYSRPAAPVSDEEEVSRMASCLVNAYMAVNEASQTVSTRFGEEVGQAFEASLLDGEHVRTIAISMFIQREKR